MEVTVLGLIKPSPRAAPVYACRGCLDTETTLYKLNDTDLVNAFSEFTGHSISTSDGYPQYICKLCLYLLRKFVKFRHRCIKAIYLLQQLEAEVGVISTASIKELDREKLKHNLVLTQTITLEVSKAIDDVDVKPESLETPLRQTYDHQNDDFVTKNEKIFDELQHIPKYDSSDFDEDDVKPLKRKTTTQKVSKTKSRKTDPNIRSSSIKKSGKIIKDINKTSEIASKDDIHCVELCDDDNTEGKNKNAKHKIGKLKRRLEKSSNNTKNKSIKRDPDINFDGEIENVSESCKKRMEEIKREIAEGKCTAVRLKNYKIHVKRLMKEAEEFNLDVVFFTKEEQILELEEIRKSERFNDAKYKCEKCCAIYRTAENLNRHAASHNPSSGSFECEICGVRFKTSRLLDCHHIKKHKNRIVCKTCGRIVTRYYKEHYEWHQGKHEIYKCDQCNKQFTLKNQYWMHVVIAHGGHLKGPECLLCNNDRGFSSECGLSIHMCTVHKTNPRCSSCKVVFADSDALTVHGNASGGCHTGYSSCPKCGENFTNKTEMMTHFNEKHRLGWFKCNECPRQFQDLKQFNKHTRNHLNIPSINSNDEKITVDFERKKNIGNNKKLKYKQKIWSRACEVCGKIQSDLTYAIHMRTHTGEKPFQCDICQKKFISKCILRTHMLTHTGVRKFKCQICLKTFLQSGHLKTHMVTHSGEKPHECEICLKRFNYTATLREHIRTVHEGLPPSRKDRGRRRKENPADKKPKEGAAKWIVTQMQDNQSNEDMCSEYL